MFKFIYSCIFLVIFSCKNEYFTIKNSQFDLEITDENSNLLSEELAKDFREFKVLDSKYINVSELWSSFSSDLEDLTESKYEILKPYIIEQDIPTIQQYIAHGDLSYELLTKFYLYRIRKFDRENERSLNSVISLNKNAIELARIADKTRFVDAPHPIFGMPILLKDNINSSDMPTTAGAEVLKDNMTDDAFIVQQLKKQGAIILGKTNLSEWAYFFCGD